MCGGAKIEPPATHYPMLPRQLPLHHLVPVPVTTGSLLQAHGALERPELVQFGRLWKGFGVENNETAELEATEVGE